jgi:peroxiredoxin
VAATPSTQRLTPGSVAPDFLLPDVRGGRMVSLADACGERGLLVLFLANHCPFVVHVRDELARIAVESAARGVGTVAIAANDVVAYPQDGPGPMRELALAEGWTFPYLFDESQEVAKAYHAACTPDLFLFDAQRRLFYRGQLDDSRPGNGVPVTGRDLRAALDALLAGAPPPPDQRPSLGCNIKWRPGNEPEAAG